jgi:hypothetical protein
MTLASHVVALHKYVDSSEQSVRSLRADWETWVRLLGGRMSPSDAVVEMDGDRGLAQRLVDGLCFTP